MTTSRPPAGFDDAEELVEQLRQVVHDLKRSAANDIATLARRIGELEADVQELQQVLQSSERQAAQLANLYVAIYQLHGSIALDDVRQAIGEIAINLLGADRFAVLVRDDERGRFDVTASAGIADGPYAGATYQGGDALVDAALSYGVVRLGPLAGSSALAVVPMMAEGAAVGALVILRLLPHKSGFGVEDRELLDVLAAHAASALLAAKLFNERTRKLRTLEGLMGLLRPGANPGEP